MNTSAATATPTAPTAPGAPAPAASPRRDVDGEGSPLAGSGAEGRRGSIEISESAAKEIAGQRAKRGTPDARIRVGVRGGGCTGFTYVFEWADELRPTDNEFSAFGVAIVVDPKSLVYLAGMQLDFVRGMMGHGFKFNNPNAKGACGCGESVNF